VRKACQAPNKSHGLHSWQGLRKHLAAHPSLRTRASGGLLSLRHISRGDVKMQPQSSAEPRVEGVADSTECPTKAESGHNDANGVYDGGHEASAAAAHGAEASAVAMQASESDANHAVVSDEAKDALGVFGRYLTLWVSE
jgi:hypothetical protein